MVFRDGAGPGPQKNTPGGGVHFLLKLLGSGRSNVSDFFAVPLPRSLEAVASLTAAVRSPLFPGSCFVDRQGTSQPLGTVQGRNRGLFLIQ